MSMFCFHGKIGGLRARYGWQLALICLGGLPGVSCCPRETEGNDHSVGAVFLGRRRFCFIMIPAS